MNDQAQAQENALQTEESDETPINGVTFEPDETPSAETETKGQSEVSAEGADPAPAKELTAEEKAQKAINKQHFKYQEEKREKLKAQQDLEEANAKLAALEKDQPAPVIPPVPEQFDDDYEVKVAARDEAIRAKAAYDQSQLAIAQREQDDLNTQAAKRQQEVQMTVDAFKRGIGDLGLDTAQMQERENIVASYNPSPDLAKFILESGPLTVKYLAENPLEMDSIVGMSPMMAAVYINSKIVPEALKLKPKQSGAPDPLDIDTGAAMPDKGNPLLKGVVYE